MVPCKFQGGPVPSFRGLRPRPRRGACYRPVGGHIIGEAEPTLALTSIAFWSE